MFDRFTQTARAVFVDAQEQARRVHHQEILAEHLLLAVLADDACTSQQVLRDHGVQPARLVDEMPALGPGDRDALKEIGIDLAAVRQRAEAAFGAGALERPRRVDAGCATTDLDRRPRAVLRRREASAGAVPATGTGASTPRDHGRSRLLGLLADDQDWAARTLQRLGVPAADVRAQVRARLDRAA